MKTIPTIPMSPVKSSQIEAIGYQGTTLAIKFRGGSVYHYADVDAKTFAALQNAESIGKHFGQHVRPHFKATKLGEKK